MTRDPKALRGGRSAAVAGLCALLAQAGCGLDKVEIPPIGGPSELALSFQLTATPDVITADGFSTSSLQVLVRNQNGQPVSGQGIFFAISDSEGRFADIGKLSNDRAVTGGNGIAQVIYRAPFRTDFTSHGSVLVQARPIGSDANGQIYRQVRIELRSAEPRLFPQIPGNDPPNCNFVVEPQAGPIFANQDVLFQTTSSDPDGSIVRYFWDFGDGTQDDKPDVVHRYGLPGEYTVTHVVTDNGGLESACEVGLPIF